MSASALLGGNERAEPRVADWLLLTAALALSATAVWFVADQPLVAAAYLGGAAVLSLAVRALLLRPLPVATGTEAPSCDWSVTVAAIERPDVAVAVTDRTGRMVCANSLFEQWFGAEAPPAGLSLAGRGEMRLEETVRRAWRDGSAIAEGLESDGGVVRAEVRRCGAADDHLVWTFAPCDGGDLAAAAERAIAGRIGEVLAAAGIQAVVVATDGTVRAANAEFARRAGHATPAEIAGAEFVSFFCQDEHDRLFYAGEGRGSQPVHLVHVPLVDPEEGGDPDPAQTASLILLLEGGAFASDGRAGIPQVEALLARLPLGLALTDRDGRFLFANDAFLRAAGHEDRVVPPYPADLVIREDKGALVDAVRRFAQGAPAAGDVAVRLRSAPSEPISLSLAGLRGLGDAAVLLSLKDSTEETRLKRQIAQATKMQAVGQLAGGVAHDFNNVLTAIIGHCDLMLLRQTPGDSDYDDIQQIKANSNRAASLTRQLLAFSRQQTLRPQVLQLPDVVSEVSHMLKRLLGERITLEVSHARDLGPVRADPGQLEQVIVNLAVNGRDAILARRDPSGGEGSGKLTLRTLAVSAADVRAMKNDVMPVADYTALVVEDTGVGIAPAHIGKIFEPFFTTKETGKGTGLGLSTAYGVVKQSGGFIFADSEPAQKGRGGGTRFTIYLPVHQDDEAEKGEAAAGSKPAAPAAAWSGGGRILLVEDEDNVRAVAERALTRAGYAVTSARDGEDGLAVVRSGQRFDLVVSDVVMPGMDGPAMARAVRDLAPELPVLFMSGYAEEQLRREIDLPNMHFIAKPFSVAQIGAAVETALRRG